MQDVSERPDVSFFIVVKLAIACAHVDGFVWATAARFTLALCFLELLDIFYLGATAAQSWNACTFRIHLGTFLLD